MNIATRKLITKELFVNRWLMLWVALGAALTCAVAPLGEITFNVAALTWLTILIAYGVLLSIYGVMHERKEQSLQFVLSLPISIGDYVRAKIIGLFLSFLLPWAVATLAAAAMILGWESVPDGLLPFTLSLSLYLLANFAIVLCGTLHARSEAMVTAVIIVTNMAVSVYMFTVGAMPGFRSHLDSPVPVWNHTVFTVMLIEFIVMVVALTLPLAMAARRRDFI